MSNIDSTTPWADSPEDVTTRTIPLEGGTAIVEHFPDGHTELIVKIGSRIAAALVLSGTEADRIGMALARPGGFTVGDYSDIYDQLHPEGAR